MGYVINTIENQNQSLISITYNNDEDTPTVSGRELHEKLKIETQYTKWLDRMTEYGFEENLDYLAVSQKRLTAQGNETTFTDHILTLDMAKQICMIQRTDIGKIYREYFLEIERQWNSPEAVMARAIKMADKKINSLKTRVNILESENQLLASQNLEWADRSFINAVVKKYAYCRCQSNYGMAWNMYKKELLYKHGIHLSNRTIDYCNDTGKKTKPSTLKMLKDEELPKAISTIVAMCKDACVDISDLLNKVKIVPCS